MQVLNKNLLKTGLRIFIPPRERDSRLSDLEARQGRSEIFSSFVNEIGISWVSFALASFREMCETVAAATGDSNPGSVSEHDVNALAAHQVVTE